MEMFLEIRVKVWVNVFRIYSEQKYVKSTVRVVIDIYCTKRSELLLFVVNRNLNLLEVIVWPLQFVIQPYISLVSAYM